jgi:transposase InsO family protein
LEECPEIKVVRLFGELQRRHPERFADGLLRTLQRRVKDWRERHGKTPELFFPQDHVPGERIQLDWFEAKSLGITIQGEPYEHLLCHTVLPCSNWEWAMPARSESFLSLKSGLQAALWQLGKVPLICQTDNSSTATHQMRRGKKERGFNDAYIALLDHYRMRPDTTNVRAPHENGDVESAHGHLRSYLKDSLDLRGSRDFDSHEHYVAFLARNYHERNGNRRELLALELLAMRALPTHALPEYELRECRVSKDGVVRLAKIGYSVPARWAGKRLRAHLYENRIEFFHGRVVVEIAERRHGDRGTYVNWRHLLEAMQRKPGAFRRYRYREHFFPSILWRKAYDVLQRAYSEGRAEREYLGLLALAKEEARQALVEGVITSLLDAGALSLDAARQALGASEASPELVEAVAVLQADLTSYDVLIATANH